MSTMMEQGPQPRDQLLAAPAARIGGDLRPSIRLQPPTSAASLPAPVPQPRTCRCCRSSSPTRAVKRSAATPEAFAAFKATKAQIDTDVGRAAQRLRRPGRRVRARSRRSPTRGRRWASSADQVIGAEKTVRRIRRPRRQASPPRVPQLQAQLDEVVRAMSAGRRAVLAGLHRPAPGGARLDHGPAASPRCAPVAPGASVAGEQLGPQRRGVRQRADRPAQGRHGDEHHPALQRRSRSPRSARPRRCGPT